MNTRTITHIVRYLLGGSFTLFGLNGFLHFLPQPPAPPAAMSFGMALMATGYMFPLIKGTEVIAGLLLLGNRYVTLALALLAPVLVNIVAFHAFLAPAGLAIPIVLIAAELYLAWSYREAYAPMLRARVEPSFAPQARATSRTASAAA
jgi:hypothetical protein